VRILAVASLKKDAQFMCRGILSSYLLKTAIQEYFTKF